MGIRRFFSDLLVLWRASGHAADQCLGPARATPRRTADRGDGADAKLSAVLRRRVRLP